MALDECLARAEAAHDRRSKPGIQSFKHLVHHRPTRALAGLRGLPDDDDKVGSTVSRVPREDVGRATDSGPDAGQASEKEGGGIGLRERSRLRHEASDWAVQCLLAEEPASHGVPQGSAKSAKSAKSARSLAAWSAASSTGLLLPLQALASLVGRLQDLQVHRLVDLRRSP